VPKADEAEQLAATLNLAALLILWSVIRWGIHLETAQQVKRLLPSRYARVQAVRAFD
jgi:hypothetical protein